MKNWIVNHKKNFILALIGAVLGYFYWYLIGCESGTCAITSVWYRTAIYGAVMGWLVTDIIFKPNRKESNNNA